MLKRHILKKVRKTMLQFVVYPCFLVIVMLETLSLVSEELTA